MKPQTIMKIGVGFILSLIAVVELLRCGVDGISILACAFVVIWIIGEVYAIPHYIKLIERKFTAILKLSIISYLAVGRNALLVIACVCYLVFILSFGWVTGWIQLYKDIWTP